MKCCVCGTELEFLEYGTKMGKNGKPAKWPIYKPCPNKANHKKVSRETIAEAPQGRPEYTQVLREIPEGIPTTKALKTGVSFAWNPKDPITKEDIVRIMNKYEKRVGKPATTARTNIGHYHKFLDTIEKGQISLEIVADLSFTPNWPRIDLDL